MPRYDPETGRVTGKSDKPGVQRISGVPWLSNNAVNLVSASLTALAAAFVALRIYGLL
jgi:hypothetical protein